MKFRDVERGWTVNNGTVVTEATAVDNIVTNWETIARGTELIGPDDSFLNTDKNLDFWIERLVVWCQPFAVLSITNATIWANCWIGLSIIDNAVADKDDIPIGFTTGAWWDDTRRSFAEYHRMLRVIPYRAIQLAAPQDNESHNVEWTRDSKDVYVQFDVKNIFLGQDENIVLWVSQSGVTDDFTGWTTGDEVRVPWMSQALIRKKKGR